MAPKPAAARSTSSGARPVFRSMLLRPVPGSVDGHLEHTGWRYIRSQLDGRNPSQRKPATRRRIDPAAYTRRARVLSPSTIRTTARGIFALAVRTSFFAVAGISRHFFGHRENIFFEVRFIPKHHAERVRSDVGHLNETRLRGGKFLVRFFPKASSRPRFFLLARATKFPGPQRRPRPLRPGFTSSRRERRKTRDHLAHHRHPRHSAHAAHLSMSAPLHLPLPAAPSHKSFCTSQRGAAFFSSNSSRVSSTFTLLPL